MYNKKPYLYLLALLSVMPGPAAIAQRSEDPNLGHFYHGRRQMQVVDESPVVTNKSGSTGGGNNNMNGGLPGRPAPLPQAGWQSFTPASSPMNSRSLPKVNNGVPPKDVPHGPAGQKGKAGKLAANKKQPSTPSTPGVASYKPYTTYPGNSNAAGTSQQSSTNVKGSLLHWARGAHRSY